MPIAGIAGIAARVACTGRPRPDASTVIPGNVVVSAHAALALTRTLITDKGPAAAEAYRRRQNKPQ